MNPDEIKRLRYYERQFLRTQDFQDEQAYHIEMRRRHLIAHHTWGIVAGLEIEPDKNSQIWAVKPGIAVDGYGREIVVFADEPLDTAQIAAQLSGQPLPATLKIWITYWIEKLDPPPPGYRECNGNDQFTRIRESFRLIYQNDPPLESDPQKWPKPYQDLPDDPRAALWFVYLGTIIWRTDLTSSQNIKLLDTSDRRYVGVVAAEAIAPANTFLIRGRNNPSPLPTDPQSPQYGGVKVKLEGSLETDRNIKGSAVYGASWAFQKKISFQESVTTNTTTWQEILQYTQTIKMPDLANLIVTLHIPFIGNDTSGSRSRIRLTFDTETISDATKYNQNEWELHEITLTGLVQNISAGDRTIRLWAAVEKGTLHIPHYNPDLIEAKLEPFIFANLYLVGFY